MEYPLGRLPASDCVQQSPSGRSCEGWPNQT